MTDATTRNEMTRPLLVEDESEAGETPRRKIIITGSRSLEGRMPPNAEWWSQKLGGAPIVRRGRRSIEQLAEEHGAWGVLVIEAERVTLYVPSLNLEYFYHPSMARRRINNVRKGQGEPMVKAMGLKPGDHVLDCTLGRGTDAIVASYVVGPEGRVVGLESVPVIAAMTEHGLKTFDANSQRTNEAMRRIEVICADYNDYLFEIPERSFDVVYFDPLFHQPVEGASAMVPLRPISDRRPLTRRAFERALEVARRCVVIKQRRNSPLWQELKPDEIVAGRKSHVEYGVFRVAPEEGPEPEGEQ